MSIYAQIHSAACSFPVRGCVAKLSPTHIVVHLSDVAPDLASIIAGTEAQLSVTSPDGCYTTFVQVESVREQVLVAALTTSFSCDQRREHPRLQCDWPAMLRGMNPGGTYGGWKSARVTDISLGGARVIVNTQNLSKHWELRFELQEGTTSRQYDDSGFNGSSVPKQLILEVKATTRYSQTCPEGLRLGLEFTPVTPRVFALVTQFLEMVEKNLV